MSTIQARPEKRGDAIAEILRELYVLEKNLHVDEHHIKDHYALEANIKFFEVARSYPKYIHWLTTRARKLDGTLLLEINDLLPRWDAEMHHGLIDMEKRNFPGLIKALVGRLVALIMEHKKNPYLVANMGCGGMEVERQVIEALREARYPGRVIFVGIDQSSTAHAIAKENLATLGADAHIEERENIDDVYLKQVAMRDHQNYTIVMAKNDIFTLHKEFPGRIFDVAFSSLFKHHLPEARKNEFDEILSAIAKIVLEYDGYKNWGVMVPQTLTTWRTPVLLNGTIFSNLRYHTKAELKKEADDHIISFTKIGTYLLEKQK